MSKPRKVEEPAVPYPAVSKIRSQEGASSQGPSGKSRLETVRDTNARLMQVHEKVLRKLAQ